MKKYLIGFLLLLLLALGYAWKADKKPLPKAGVTPYQLEPVSLPVTIAKNDSDNQTIKARAKLPEDNSTLKLSLP